MSVYTALSDYRNYSIENYFSLEVLQKTNSTKIFMQLFLNQVNTSNIPFIVEILQENLPNVLLTQCFNDENIPFRIEVRNTELGHLFEHILLEYLCQLKIAKGFATASYAGRTRWNWIKYPHGSFHIQLNCGIRDADILPIAIHKTNELMKTIMQSTQPALFSPSKTSLTQNGLKNGKRMKRKNR
jgi:hypothetical protein